MGFRFRKSFGKGPLRVTVSKSGIGYSVGGKGFRYTKKAGGGTRTTVSIPGAGISHISDTGSNSNRKSQTTNTGLPYTQIPVIPANDAEAIPGYCKHCYRKIDEDTIICPACGKSQMAKVAPPPADPKAVLGSICFFTGLICMGFAPMISLLAFLITFVLAIALAIEKKNS